MTQYVTATRKRLPLGHILAIPATILHNTVYRRMIRQLESLDDQILKDIGLTRGDLLNFKSHPRRIADVEGL
jgi:uncharacterized protein YjiS (DUF1127 family)